MKITKNINVTIACNKTICDSNLCWFFYMSSLEETNFYTFCVLFNCMLKFDKSQNEMQRCEKCIKEFGIE